MSPSLRRTASICHKGLVKDLNTRRGTGHCPRDLASPTRTRHCTCPSMQLPPFRGGKVKDPVVQLAEFENLDLGKGRLLVF